MTKRVVKNKAQRSRLIRSPAMTQHKFVRHCSSELFVPVQGSGSTGVTINFANEASTSIGLPAITGFHYAAVGLAFSLASLPGYTELTALFDQYKLDRVRVRIMPLTTEAPSQEPAGNGPYTGMVHSVLDQDDGVAPTPSVAGVHALQQYETYRVDHAVRREPITWDLVPRIAVATYGAGVFTSYANTTSWIDANSPGVEHYGLKMIFELYNPSNAVTYGNFKLSCEYHISARQVR